MWETDVEPAPTMKCLFSFPETKEAGGSQKLDNNDEKHREQWAVTEMISFYKYASSLE